MFSNEQSHVTAEENTTNDARRIQIVPPQSQQNKAAHTRITFNREEGGNKKKSVLERLGKRHFDEFEGESAKRTKTTTEDEEERRRRVASVARKSEVVAKPREVRFCSVLFRR